MVPEPLKFRCEHCGQLLGVSPSRAGRSVKCPKCGDRVAVPSPGDRLGARPDGPASSPGESGLMMDRPGGAGDATKSPSFFDDIDLDPDDLRTLFPTDSEDSIPVIRAPADEETSGEGSVGSGVSKESLPFLPRPDPVERSPIESPDPGPAFSFEPSPSGGVAIATGPPASLRGTGEPTAIGADESLSPRGRPGRDVVMPRVAVVAWSLFVLLALFVSFAAGLLAGHFVWIRAD